MPESDIKNATETARPSDEGRGEEYVPALLVKLRVRRGRPARRPPVEERQVQSTSRQPKAGPPPPASARLSGSSSRLADAVHHGAANDPRVGTGLGLADAGH